MPPPTEPSPTTPSWRSGTRRAGGEGSEDQAIPLLRQAFDVHPGWGELLERLPAAGLFPDDAPLIARLIGTASERRPRAFESTRAESLPD